MTLFLIGLGLGDEKDITVKGLEVVKQADVVYLEHYTSILGVDKAKLEKFYGREVILADRELVEQHAEEQLVKLAKHKNVALLVVGDPFGATTHTDLVLRAKAAGAKVEIVHNASILNAVGVVGLELYKYGATTSIPFWEPGFEPETPYDAIKENKARGLHTLCLLDIKVKEPSKEDLQRGVSTPRPPRFMTVTQALESLLAIEQRRREGVLGPETLVVGVARIGQHDQRIIAGTIAELLKTDFSKPLHSLIVPGTLHHVEEEALEQWRRG